MDVLKRKSEDEDDSESPTAFFPACRVCDGPGNGIHYGVNTCDACKGFFHRSMRLHSHYKCKEENRPCRIKFGTGKMCQQCRYEKCLAMGLSRKAIKKGRYTAEKRTEIIINAKRLEGERRHVQSNLKQLENLSENLLKSRIGDGHTPRSDSDTVLRSIKSKQTDLLYPSLSSALSSNPSSSSSSSSPNSGKPNTDDSFSNPGKTLLSHGSSPSSSRVSTLNPPHASRQNITVANSTPIHRLSSTQESPYSINSTVSPDNSSNHPLSISSEFSPQGSESSSPEEDQASPLELTHGNSQAAAHPLAPPADAHDYSYYHRAISASSSPEDGRVVIGGRGGPYDGASGGTPSMSENSVDSPYGQSPGLTDAETRQDVELVASMYQDPDAVTKSLLSAYSAAMDGHTYSQEEAQAEAIRHYEQCKIKADYFGQLERLPDDEYHRIYEETGMDVDGRLSQFSQFADGLEICIRRMVQFVKAIPGFTVMDMDDKIKVVKYGRLEFSALCNYIYANLELGVIRCMSRKWLCGQELAQHNSENKFHCFLSLCARLQSFNFNEEERVLLTAMAAMSPHRCGPSTSAVVHEIQDRLSQMFMNSLRKHRPRGELVYAEVKNTLKYFREFERQMIALVQSCSLRHFNLNERPLVKEMVADFYISADDLDN